VEAVCVTAGTWASGTNLNTARRSVGGNGTQTAALASGGADPANTGATELYNGSSWTEVSDLNTARRGPENVGTQTAALTIGDMLLLYLETQNLGMELVGLKSMI
jgi:hypothetical protein